MKDKRCITSWRTVSAALLALGLSSMLQAQDNADTTTTQDTNKKDQTVQMGSFEVTGSRIPRLDTETVSPVVTLSAQTLANTGFVTIGDALRSLPFNSGQALTPADAGTSFTPGISTINLRGLGNNNTLVLINGRRAVPYAAPGFDGHQTMFDLESIPDAAIDRVEILKDGGSAIYGSDAVGGVINFILKKDFTGLTTTFEVGNYGRTNAMMKSVAVTAGAHSNKTSVFVSASWRHQDPIYARELPWTDNADQSKRANKADPKYVWTGWEDLDWPNDIGMPKPANYADALAAIEPLIGLSNSPITDGFFNLNSSRGFPGYVTVPGVGKRTFKTATNNPTVAGAVAGSNSYNYQQTVGLFPTTDKYSMYTHMQYDITYNLYAFTELSFTRTHAMVEAAATPADIETSKGLDPSSQLTIPSYNPYNPWGVNITNGRRRLVENGNRINDVTSDTPRFLVGLGGTLDAIPALDTWKWETGLLYSKNTVTNLNSNTVPDSSMQQALMGLTRNGDGSLSWNSATPQNQRVYYNWFGYNSQAMTNFLNTDNPNVSMLEFTSMDFSAGGDLATFKDGKIGMSIGGEHQTQKLSDIKTLMNATGNVLGGGEGTSSFGRRTVDAVYAEADISVFKKLLEFQLAGRFEKYSDQGFEQKVRPKIGVKIRPLDWLVLRASYSQAFKAPDLSYLYASSTTSFTSGQIQDPVTHQTVDQLQIVTSGNPSLQPETTNVTYAGITLDAPGKLKGLTFDVDWFKYKQSNLLAQLSDFYGYSQFLVKAAAGDPLFADKVVRDPGTNQLLYIKDSYANIEDGLYQGYDFSASYQWTTNSMGKFNVGVQATMLDRLEIEGSDFVGGYLNAKWNGVGTFSWQYRDWAFNMYEVYLGKRTNTIDFGPLVSTDDFYIEYTVKPQYITNLSVSYMGFKGMRVTLGVNNALDQEPPEDPYTQDGTTLGINSAEPVFWYVRLEKSF